MLTHIVTRSLVVHCKRAPFDVYIGRPGPRGNPFSQVLGCWCKPDRCHGDVLARIANA